MAYVRKTESRGRNKEDDDDSECGSTSDQSSAENDPKNSINSVT